MNTNRKAVCTTGLIIINVAVFFLFLLLGKENDTLFLLEHGAMYEPYVIQNREYYRLFTSMFLHFGIEHLANNMVMLGAIGWNLEPVTGRIRFLLIYFAGGLGGNMLSLAMNQLSGREVVSVGASGAVFSLMGALLCAVLFQKSRRVNLSRRGMLLMVALSLYFGLTSTGVDNAAHIGGLLCGFALQMLSGHISAYQREKMQ